MTVHLFQGKRECDVYHGMTLAEVKILCALFCGSFDVIITNER